MDNYTAPATPDSTATCQIVQKRQSGTGVFELKVPMNLQAGTEVLAAGHSGIKIEVLEESRCCCYACTNEEPTLPHYFVSSSKPIRILTQHETRLSPVEPLGVDFAQGWNKLTDELKIMILGYNLSQQNVITHKERHVASQRGSTAGCILCHHIALGLAFATLATQVFYETNTIRLEQGHLHPRVVRQYIKRAFVPITDPIISGWRTLRTLSEAAAAASGFAGVQHVTVEFDMNAIAEEFEEDADHYMPTSHIDLHFRNLPPRRDDNSNLPSQCTMATPRPCEGDVTEPTHTPETIELQNLMTLKAGATSNVKCQKTIQIAMSETISSVVISAETPIDISVAGPTRISPAGRLSESFARGWRKIPVELQFKILGYNLVSERKIDVFRRDYVKRVEGFTHSRILCQHVSMGPDFASLSLQVFYEENTFVFRSPYSVLPPLSVRKYIRNINFKVDFLEPRCWRKMEELAAGKLGFDGVQHIKIYWLKSFSTLWPPASPPLPGKRIHFNCKGSICTGVCRAAERYLLVFSHSCSARAARKKPDHICRVNRKAQICMRDPD